jgi:CRISPR-associated protein Csb1
MIPNLSPLDNATKLLFAIELQPLQGERFQPTGFPSLGAATYESKHGANLLVESAQSMANRLESVCWDDSTDQLRKELTGLSYVRVERQNKYLTSSITEAHRINSPYLLEGADKTFFNQIKDELAVFDQGPVDRKLLARTLLKYDASSLLHGVFLAKKELAGGRLRIARALSAFIEAQSVRQAISGGVKNDHVNPSGSTKDGFGNVPFSREEFTAEKITLFVNLDLAQIRGYGLGRDVENFLVLLALFKLRVLLDSDLRLRTACNLEVKDPNIIATKPRGFALPPASDLVEGLAAAIAKVKSQMAVTTVTFNDEMKKGKEFEESKPSSDEAEAEGDDTDNS